MLNLVTGATGLIGGHLVEALVLRGDQVRALVRPTSNTTRLRDLGVDIRVGSLLDNATLMAAARGVERIYHCAGLVSDWGLPADFAEANVNGVRAVLAAATRAEVSKFIHMSTTDIYGYPGRPAVESERPSPRGFPYADSKIEGEALVWKHCRQVGLPACILRPATVYGPRCRLLVFEVARAIAKRRMVMIDGGRHVAGLTYVGNLVDAMILAADAEASVGQAYNISDGTQVTWKEYLSALADLIQMPRPSRSLPHWLAYALASVWENYNDRMGRTQRPSLTRTMVELMGTDQDFPIDKAKRDLGYRPRVSLQEGIKHTGGWLRQEGFLDEHSALLNGG
jgi:nucleoside-diphosphate-sugar epimerase